jgi:hypothetical protein
MNIIEKLFGLDDLEPWEIKEVGLDASGPCMFIVLKCVEDQEYKYYVEETDSPGELYDKIIEFTGWHNGT